MYWLDDQTKRRQHNIKKLKKKNTNDKFYVVVYVI